MLVVRGGDGAPLAAGLTAAVGGPSPAWAPRRERAHHGLGVRMVQPVSPGDGRWHPLGRQCRGLIVSGLLFPRIISLQDGEGWRLCWYLVWPYPGALGGGLGRALRNSQSHKGLIIRRDDGAAGAGAETAAPGSRPATPGSSALNSGAWFIVQVP